jgi:hypothetical protein
LASAHQSSLVWSYIFLRSDEITPKNTIPLGIGQFCTLNSYLPGSYIPASDRVKVIVKIKSKNGISIDDLSDWGGTLGPVRHSDRPIIEQRQFEVLSQEGYFRKSSSPTLIKVDGEGVEWYEVILEETGIPLRDIP